MSSSAHRLHELLSEQPADFDRVMATVASVAPNPPSEDEIVERLDELAAGLTSEATPEAVVSYVYGELGFVGNTANYYGPANSFIHRVLERRRGIPITLAAVGVEIGRRVGVELTVVGLPGHVILGDGAAPQRWFDPFAAGAPLDVEGCRRLFANFHPIGQFDPAMLGALSAAATTSRMLNNLKLAYRRVGDLGQMVKVVALAVEIPGADPAVRMEYAALLAATGRDDQAAAERDRLAELDPARAEAHKVAARRHRARRN